MQPPLREGNVLTVTLDGTTLSPAAGGALSFEVPDVDRGEHMVVAEVHDQSGKLICSADLTFRLVEFPSPDFRASMEKIAAEIAFPMEALAHG